MFARFLLVLVLLFALAGDSFAGGRCKGCSGQAQAQAQPRQGLFHRVFHFRERGYSHQPVAAASSNCASTGCTSSQCQGACAGCTCSTPNTTGTVCNGPNCFK